MSDMKINIVSREYPIDTPQIILDNQASITNRIDCITGILRKVAKKYQDLLFHDAIFRGKLQNLTVNVHPASFSPDPDTCDDATPMTDGEYFLDRSAKKPRGMIDLYVCVDDSPREIAYVFAHELSHMLVDTQRDTCLIGGQSRYGCKPGTSCINRLCFPEMELHGSGLEESIADNLAMYLVSRCRFPGDAGTHAQQVSQWQSRRTFAPLLAAAFGDPLTACRYIDEFRETMLPELSRPSWITKDGIEEEPQEFAEVYIRNVFWYCVATNQFHMIVNTYNDVMGEGAWRELCRHMDAVQADIHRYGYVGDDAINHQKQAEALIGEFFRRC